MQLDRRLGGFERRPGEQAQAQIDRAGIQRIHGVVQFDTERLVGVELARSADQHRREVRPDAPVAQLVGVGEGRALDWRAKAHGVELGGIGRQARFDVAQRLAPGDLREGHRTELFGTRQRAHAGVALVAFHNACEAGPRHEFHHLGEQRLASVQRCPSEVSTPGSYPLAGESSSNRHQPKSACRPRQYLISGWLRVI